jgi:hypothetical protein
MRVCSVCLRVVIAIVIMAVLCSTGEAGGFRRNWVAYRTSHQSVRPEPAASPTVATPTVASPKVARPTTISVSSEVVVAKSSNATSIPTPTVQCPVEMRAARRTGDWSVLPTKFSDYGKFPPYYH